MTGCGIMFCNVMPNGDADSRTAHRACPVPQGERERKRERESERENEGERESDYCYVMSCYHILSPSLSPPPPSLSYSTL